jgi:hypothetical protein
VPCLCLQWTYYAYLAAVKEQDGAAMSMGRIDAFLDTYFEKDLKAGRITEEAVQELIDQFVMKMRIVRWVTCCLCSSLRAVCNACSLDHGAVCAWFMRLVFGNITLCCV